MGTGAVQRLQGWGIERVELGVVLPILLMVSSSLFADSERAVFLAG
jgi:hypothetical protein